MRPIAPVLLFRLTWRQAVSRSLAMLLLFLLSASPAAAAPRWTPAERDERAQSAGLRKLSSRHLVLYTDLPSDPEVDELPQVFDLAVPQWCEYFSVSEERVRDWQAIAYVIQDKPRFLEVELLPRELPPFLHAYFRDEELWVYEQPSAYYRRHLLLHEGTHSFMSRFLGGTGPPWFMEGTAELLSTHRWRNGQLKLRYFPADKDETPYWGRIKLIQDATAAGKALTLEQIFQYSTRAHLEVDSYAWCWAAAAFFDFHPQYQSLFRQQLSEVKDPSPEFSRRFYEQLRPHLNDLREQWQLFVVDLHYGYDLPRELIQRRPAEPLSGSRTFELAVEHGWQSSGIRLEAGRTYEVAAEGRYQLRQEGDELWWCEAGGVTLHYHRGKPLGLLMGALRDERQPLQGLTPLARPEPIGLARTLTPTRSGILYLRINEPAAGLADNEGRLTITVRELEKAAEGPSGN